MVRNNMIHKGLTFYLRLIIVMIILCSFSNVASAEGYNFVQNWPTTGYFDGPSGITSDSSGNIYVADQTRIRKFSQNGTLIYQWEHGIEKHPLINRYFALAVDNSGNVYMTSDTGNSVRKYDSSGALITTWACLGYSPFGIAVDSAGNVYVAESYNGRIVKYGSNGNFIEFFGWMYCDFSSPTSLAFDASGDLWVVNAGNGSIMKLGSNGMPLSQWGSSGSSDGQFNNPFGIALDANANVYITDEYNKRVQKFDSNGTFITKWGSNGTGDGQFSLPRGIAIDSTGAVYVSDVMNGTIQKYTRDQPPTITNCSPLNNAVNVAIDQTITVSFSESVRESVYFDDLTIRSGDTVLNYTYSIDGNNFKLNPSSDLANSTTYALYIPSGSFEDLLGNRLLDSYTINFTTTGTSAETPGGGRGGGSAALSTNATDIEKNITSEGIYSSEDKAVTIEVPPGGLEPGVSIKLTAKKTNPKSINISAPDEKKFASDIYEFGPNGMRFNKPITITLKYNPEIVGGNIIAPFYFNESNNSWELLKGIKVDTAAHTVSFMTDHFSQYTLMSYSNPTFSDIRGHWAKADIEYLFLKGVVNGKNNTRFDPEGEITRAEFAKMIVCALVLQLEQGSKNFVDTIPEEWYYQWVETAYKAGIINGYGGYFKPEAKITRQEMAAILSRTLTLKNISLDPNLSVLEQFKDCGKITPWARSDFAKVIKAKIITGDNNSFLSPLQNATRAEAVTMISKMLYEFNL